MAYDRPYRVERTVIRVSPEGHVLPDCFEIYLPGSGVVAKGENYMEGRRLIELANEAVAMKAVGRDR